MRISKVLISFLFIIFFTIIIFCNIRVATADDCLGVYPAALIDSSDNLFIVKMKKGLLHNIYLEKIGSDGTVISDTLITESPKYLPPWSVYIALDSFGNIFTHHEFGSNINPESTIVTKFSNVPLKQWSRNILLTDNYYIFYPFGMNTYDGNVFIEHYGCHYYGAFNDNRVCTSGFASLGANGDWRFHVYGDKFIPGSFNTWEFDFDHEGDILIPSMYYDQSSQTNIAIINKINSDGAKVWEKYYTPDYGFYYYIFNPMYSNDGGYLFVVDYREDEFSQHPDQSNIAKIEKLDINGNALWVREINDELEGAYLTNAKHIKNEKIVISKIQYIQGTFNLFLNAYDLNGDLDWDIEIDDGYESIYYDGIETGNGIVAYYFSTNDGTIVNQYNAGGILLSSVILSEIKIQKVIYSGDVLYVIGMINEYSDEQKYQIVKISQSGDVIWKNNYDNPAVCDKVSNEKDDDVDDELDEDDDNEEQNGCGC